MTRDDKLNDSGNAPDAKDFIFSLCLGVLIMYTGNTYSRVQCVHLGTEDRTNGPVPVFRKGEPCYRLFKIAYPDSTFFYLILWVWRGYGTIRLTVFFVLSHDCICTTYKMAMVFFALDICTRWCTV